jgi:hypothetical protein
MKKISLALLLILFSSSAFATTVERLTLDDMVRRAHAIVHGKVLASTAHWSADHRLILTTSTVEVQETLKGHATRTLELTTIGGTIGDLTLVAAGMPTLHAGEEMVLFVEDVGPFKTIVGLSQGKFSVSNGEVSNPTAHLKMHLTDFKEEIRSRLK